MAEDDQRSKLIDEVTIELGELRQAADRLDEVVARQFGLNRTDLRCLGTLYLHGRMTAGELADESGLSPGAITAVLDRMERAGYANRVSDPEDRRRVVIVSTAATRELGARIYGEVDVRGRGLLESRTVVELTLLRDYLRAMREVFESQAGDVAGQAAQRAGGAERPGAEAPDTSAPLAGILSGRLQISKGASRVTIAGDPQLTELYTARFEGAPPDVHVVGGTVNIQHRRSFRPFDWRGLSTDITLNATIPWAISLKGGMWKFTADLRALRLDSLEITGGASDIEMWLPAPAGTVAVAISGGASKIILHRPQGVPLRAVISGGASQMTLDDQRLGAVGGRNRIQTDGFDASADRYELRFSGGASQVTIDMV